MNLLLQSSVRVMWKDTTKLQNCQRVQRTQRQVIKQKQKTCCHKYNLVDILFVLIIIFMTDNYQIDKNSKLFQKFLNLKNNKTNEPNLQKSFQQDSTHTLKTNIKAPIQKSYESNKQYHEQVLPQKKLQLHVTISDIQQAASISIHEDYPQMTKKENKQKEYMTHLVDKIETNYVEKKPQDQKYSPNQQYNQFKTYQSLKPQRARDLRTRDFGDRNKNKNDNKMQRSFRANDAPTTTFKPNPPDIIIKNEEFKKQKQNMMSLNEDQQITIKEENMFILGSREGQYKRKYDKIHQKYEQLKEIVQKQRKQKQQELNDKEAELQLIRQKYFEVRSNQDTLTGQLKRIKQRFQSENMVRTKFQEEVKELTFKIQELEDMLDGKDANLKKKSDQTNHWKNQNQQLRGEVKFLNAEIQKLEDRCQYLESQNKMVKKDIQNKQFLIQQLRKNINSIIEENNIAKDQIYKLTIKAYHYEQENQVLKGDLMRRDREQPHQMSVIQENYMRNIQSLSPKRRERPEKIDRIIDRQQRPEKNQKETGQGNNRRRQFARQRANTSKPQRVQRPTEREEKKPAQEFPERKIQQQQNERKTEPVGGKHREIISRVQYLQSQLQKRKDQKAMNGKLRRQKIQMERQLEQLIVKLNQ